MSSLETISIGSTDRHVEYVAAAHFEAPNWSRDGKYLVFNQDGTLHRLAFDGSEPTLIPTAPQIHCNNDHGISPDGQFLAISDQSQRRPHIARLHCAHRRRHAAADYAQRRRRTGTAGRPTARRWLYRPARRQLRHLLHSRGRAAKKRGSPPPPAWTTARSIRPTARIFTSTPNAPGKCRSGA